MKKFDYGKIFLLGFGFFGVSVIWSIYNAFVPIFLDDRFGLSAGWVGFFMTLDNFAGLLIQPPVGAWSDKLKTPIGRRLPFILIGAPLSAVAFGIIPLAQVLPLFVACTSTLLISMAFWRTPVVALMPDVTPSRYRSQANGIINFMGGLGALVSFFVGSKLFDIQETYPFWLGSVLVILSAILLFIFVREPKTVHEEAKEETPGIWESIKELFREKEKSPLRILLAILFWFISYNAIEAFFTLFGTNYLKLSAGESAFQMTFIALMFLIFSLPAGFIGSRFGRKKTIITGIIVMTISIVLLRLIPADVLTQLVTTIPVVGNLRIIGLVMMLAGVAWALININSLPMVVDMTEDSRVGTYTGLYYFASTLAAIAGPNIFGQVVEWGGNDYSLVMAFSPIFLVFAFISILGVKRGEAKQ